MTVVIHHLDEADEADQIYIVDRGEVITQGSALDIRASICKKHLEDSFQGETAIESLKSSGMSVEQQDH